MRIFLDVGAYNGNTAAAVLQDTLKFDKIYCFEPIPAFCKAIREMKSDKIVVCEFGLWKETSTKNIYEAHSPGASIFIDKFRNPIVETQVKMVKASDWFAENIKDTDEVYLKLNCEGAECDILSDLMDSGQYKKISVLMVDFDARKIPSQKHKEWEIREKFKTHPIPVIITVENSDRRKWPKDQAAWVHHWLGKAREDIKKI